MFICQNDILYVVRNEILRVRDVLLVSFTENCIVQSTDFVFVDHQALVFYEMDVITNTIFIHGETMFSISFPKISFCEYFFFSIS